MAETLPSSVESERGLAHGVTVSEYEVIRTPRYSKKHQKVVSLPLKTASRQNVTTSWRC